MRIIRTDRISPRRARLVARPDRNVRYLRYRVAPRALSEDPDVTYRLNRKQRRANVADPDVRLKVRTAQHVLQRQGDEIACSCGLRWPVGENHP